MRLGQSLLAAGIAALAGLVVREPLFGARAGSVDGLIGGIIGQIVWLVAVAALVALAAAAAAGGRVVKSAPFAFGGCVGAAGVALVLSIVLDVDARVALSCAAAAGAVAAGSAAAWVARSQR